MNALSMKANVAQATSLLPAQKVCFPFFLESLWYTLCHIVNMNV